MINFFNIKDKTLFVNDALFGLIDGIPASIDLSNNVLWNAKIVNKQGVKIKFTPLDNNIRINQTGTNNKESICDCMFTFKSKLYLIELKDMQKGAISAAKPQLENTLKLLNRHNPDFYNKYKTRKAFICNKAHKAFQTVTFEDNALFRDNYGFHLDINYEIAIK